MSDYTREAAVPTADRDLQAEDHGTVPCPRCGGSTNITAADPSGWDRSVDVWRLCDAECGWKGAVIGEDAAPAGFPL